MPGPGLRVLMLVFNQTGRGSFLRAFYLARELVKQGHQVSFIATSPGRKTGIRVRTEAGMEFVESPDLLSGPLRSGWDPWNAWNRKRWIGSRRFDIVHAFESRPTVLYPALHAQRMGAKLVMDWCDWFGKGGSLEERPNRLVRAVLGPVETHFELNYRSRADGATAINRLLAAWVIRLGVPAERTLLLRNGSDLSRGVLDKAEARRLCGLPEQAPLIGFVGGTYTQDAHFMAQAFNLVQAALPESRLVLAGNFNRDIRPLLVQPQAAIITGQADDKTLFQHLSACDVCWLPLVDSGANRGRLPLKLNDYMSAGRPVVSTAVGDLPELIGTHRMGIVTPAQPEPLAAAVIDLLRDPARMEMLGRAARQAAESELNWSILAEQLERFYMKILHVEPAR